MTRILLSLCVVAGLIGCAQAGKKDAPADTKASDAKAADAKTAPADAKAKDSKATKGKDAKAAKADAAKADAKAAAPAAPAVEGTVTCESGADKRSIAVKAVDKGCEVMYEKNGTTTSPGSGKAGLDNCIRIQDKIKTNLVNSGFKCS